MAKFRFNLLVMGGLALTVRAMGVARADGPGIGVNPTIMAAETRVSLGFAITGTHYDEAIGGASDRESGVLPGFIAGASRIGAVFGLPNVYTGVVYNFAGGPLAYRGYVQGGPGPVMAPYDNNDHARFNTVEVRLGRAVPLADSIDLIPFVAAGYQNWYRNVGGEAGYGEFYRAALAGAGAKLDVAVTDRLVMSARIEGLAVIGGRASAPALGFAGDFGTSGEEDVHLGADWRLSNALHLFAGLGVTHFNYAGSGVNNGYYEPPSNTLVVSSEVGVSFGFR